MSPFFDWLNKALNAVEGQPLWTDLAVPKEEIAKWRTGYLPPPRLLGGVLAILLLNVEHHPLRDEWITLADMPFKKACSYENPIHEKLMPTLGHYVLEPAWEDLQRSLVGVPWTQADGFLRKAFIESMLLKAAG